MKFRLTCECGGAVYVTAGDCGSSVVCSCGRSVNVPLLSVLRASSAGPSGPELTDGERLFVRRSKIRLAGVILVLVGEIWGIVSIWMLLTQPNSIRDEALGLLVASLAGLVVRASGYILWGKSKGYSTAMSVLLYFLGPVGLLVLICFPSREL